MRKNVISKNICMPNLHPELLIPINGIDVMSIVEFFGIYRFKKISASKNIHNNN